MKRFLATLCLTLAALCTAQVFAAAVDNAVFSDEFKADSRQQYKVDGTVDWESGALTLRAAAKIGRQTPGGAQVTLDFTVEWPALEEDDQRSETWVVFTVEKQGESIVEFIRRRTQGRIVGEIRVVDRFPKDGKLFEQVHRVFPLPSATGAQSYRVKYHQGLITVQAGAKRIAIGYVANLDTPVVSWRLDQHRLAATLRRIAVDGATSPKLSEEASAQLDEARKLDDEWQKHYQTGRYSKAIPQAERAMALVQQATGTQSDRYARSTNSLGVLHEKASDLRKAEQYYLVALKLRKQLLGAEHPDYAQTVHNLGLLYEKMGRYREVAAPLSTALNIRKTVLGPKAQELRKFAQQPRYFLLAGRSVSQG